MPSSESKSRSSKSSKDRSSRDSSKSKRKSRNESSSKERRSKERSSSKSEPTPPQRTPVTQPKHCYNCSSVPPSLYCSQCAAHFCSPCDSTIHSSSLSHHARTPHPSPERKCLLHPDQIISCYCDVCQRCMCHVCSDQCSRDPLHSVLSIEDACKRLQSRLDDVIQSKITSKRKSIVKSYGVIENFELQLCEEASEIQRQSADFLQSILSRLNTQKEIILAKPRQKRRELLELLRVIDTSSVSKINKSQSEMIDFLSNFESIINKLNHVVNSDLPACDFEIEDAKTNLPREVESINLNRPINQSLSRDVEVTDSYFQSNTQSKLIELETEMRIASDMLEILLKDGNFPNHCESCSKLSSELTKWMSLTDKYANELSNLVLKCRYCEVMFSLETANERCGNGLSHYWEKLG
ncbi:hypothetical protein P9112_001238 [Eukaryota sp. TZLM1-RC]